MSSPRAWMFCSFLSQVAAVDVVYFWHFGSKKLTVNMCCCCDVILHYVPIKMSTFFVFL